MASGYWWAAYLRLIGLWWLFLGVYAACAWITARRDDVGTFRFAWEAGMPFVPWMLLPYLSVGVLAACAPLLGLTTGGLNAFTARMAAATVAAGLCYLLWPLELAEARPHVAGFFGRVYELVKDAAPPTNLCPSLHVAYAVILWPLYRRRVGRFATPLIDGWFLLIVVSVVLVRQHHVVDVIGGLLLAAACLTLIPGGRWRLMPDASPVR